MGSERDRDPRAPHKSSKFSRSSLVNAKKSLGKRKSCSSLAERSSSHLAGASSPPTRSPVGHHRRGGETSFLYFLSFDFPRKVFFLPCGRWQTVPHNSTLRRKAESDACLLRVVALQIGGHCVSTPRRLAAASLVPNQRWRNH